MNRTIQPEDGVAQVANAMFVPMMPFTFGWMGSPRTAAADGFGVTAVGHAGQPVMRNSAPVMPSMAVTAI